MKIMAIDFGDARTGVACSDGLGMLASPIEVIHEKDEARVIGRIAELVAIHGAERLIVGYPKNMNNTVGERGEKSENLVAKLSAVLAIPVELWDERSTTVSAIRYLNETNTRGKKRKNIVDAVAATIILESYLQWYGNQKND